jgi:hypothetical protein
LISRNFVSHSYIRFLFFMLRLWKNNIKTLSTKWTAGFKFLSAWRGNIRFVMWKLKIRICYLQNCYNISPKWRKWHLRYLEKILPRGDKIVKISSIVFCAYDEGEHCLRWHAHCIIEKVLKIIHSSNVFALFLLQDNFKRNFWILAGLCMIYRLMAYIFLLRKASRVRWAVRGSLYTDAHRSVSENMLVSKAVSRNINRKSLAGKKFKDVWYIYYTTRQQYSSRQNILKPCSKRPLLK